MATRARIAAAACLMASGLLVAGGSASLAFASPDDGGSTGTSDAAPGNAAEGSTEPSAEPTRPRLTTILGGLIGGKGSPAGTSGPFTRPTATVGNGRPGIDLTLPSGILPDSGDIEVPSNLPEDAADGAELPGEADAGKPDEGTSGEGAGTAVPDSPGTAEPQGTATVVEPTVAQLQVIDPALLVPTLLDPVLLAGEEAAVPACSLCPWWGWDQPEAPDGGDGSSGGDGALPESPLFNSPIAPLMQIPLLRIPGQLLQIPGQLIHDIAQPIIEAAVTGLATAASQLPFASLPPVVLTPGAGVGDAVSNGGSDGVAAPAVELFAPPVASQPEVPAAPPAHLITPASLEHLASPPAAPASNELLAAPTYRMGYVDYLRAAGLGEVAAVAVPGVTGMLILTSAGGLIGYRQARAGRAIHAGGPARFMS